MHYITNCMLVFSGCAGLWVALACAVGGNITLDQPQIINRKPEKNKKIKIKKERKKR